MGIESKWVVGSVLFALACNRTAPVEAAAVGPALADGAASAPRGLPSGHPATGGGASLAAAGGITGTIAEKIDAATYSYLRLTTADGEVWAAVPQTALAVGADATIANAMPMRDFESKTLNRKFATIYFGTLGAALPAGHPAPDAAAAGAPHGPDAMDAVAKPPAEVDVHVARAAGADARTVAEIWEQKAALKEKAVTLHGKVVKFTAGVMGKNWLHLRDGSGSDARHDDDITVTSASGTAAVGDVVTVKGVVRLEKDFGAGYAYAVIIEDASVAK